MTIHKYLTFFSSFKKNNSSFSSFKFFANANPGQALIEFIIIFPLFVGVLIGFLLIASREVRFFQDHHTANSLELSGVALGSEESFQDMSYSDEMTKKDMQDAVADIAINSGLENVERNKVYKKDTRPREEAPIFSVNSKNNQMELATNAGLGGYDEIDVFGESSSESDKTFTKRFGPQYFKPEDKDKKINEKIEVKDLFGIHEAYAGKNRKSNSAKCRGWNSLGLCSSENLMSFNHILNSSEFSKKYWMDVLDKSLNNAITKRIDTLDDISSSVKSIRSVICLGEVLKKTGGEPVSTALLEAQTALEIMTGSKPSHCEIITLASDFLYNTTKVLTNTKLNFIKAAEMMQ